MTPEVSSDMGLLQQQADAVGRTVAAAPPGMRRAHLR